MFTLGVCFLEQAMLADCSLAYNVAEYQLDYDRLQELLHFTRNIYGEDIFNLLDRMIKYLPEDRIALEELHSYIDKSGELLSSISPRAHRRDNSGFSSNSGQIEPPRKASLQLLSIRTGRNNPT